MEFKCEKCGHANSLNADRHIKSGGSMTSQQAIDIIRLTQSPPQIYKPEIDKDRPHA